MNPDQDLESCDDDKKSGDEDKSSQKKRTTIRWDEETIAEHDKLRGTRQKIDEPSTPYHEYLSTDDEQMSDASSAGSHPVGNQYCEELKSGWACSPERVLGPLPGEPCAELSGMDAEAQVPKKSPRRSRARLSVQVLADSWNQVEAKLEEHKARFDETKGTPVCGSTSDEDADDEGHRRCVEEFRKKRASHYNEFQRLKEWRMSHTDDEEETGASKEEYSENDQGAEMNGDSNCNGKMDET